MNMCINMERCKEKHSEQLQNTGSSSHLLVSLQDLHSTDPNPKPIDKT